MPTWSPPADVRFDHHAAAELVAEVQRTLGTIDQVGRSIAAAMTAARTHWSGATRERVENALTIRRGELRIATDELRFLLAELSEGVERAYAEQERREALRAHWERERRAEMVSR